MDLFQTFDSTNSSALEETPKSIKVISVILLAVGVLMAIGLIVAAFTQRITVYSLSGLITAAGFIATAFAIWKMKAWGFYLFALLTAASTFYNIYLVIIVGAANTTGTFVYLLINLALLIYLWRIYRKSWPWMIFIAVIFISSIVIIALPKKNSLLLSQAAKPVAAKPAQPLNFNNQKSGYSITLPPLCRRLYYIKVDLKDPDVFLCSSGSTVYQLAIKNTGIEPGNIDNILLERKQSAFNNSIQISEEKDFSLDVKNGQPIVGKQMKEEYTQNKTHMKQWIVLLPTKEKNTVLEFMFTDVLQTFDANSKKAADILNSLKFN